MHCFFFFFCGLIDCSNSIIEVRRLLVIIMYWKIVIICLYPWNWEFLRGEAFGSEDESLVLLWKWMVFTQCVLREFDMRVLNFGFVGIIWKNWNESMKVSCKTIYRKLLTFLYHRSYELASRTLQGPKFWFWLDNKSFYLRVFWIFWWILLHDFAWQSFWKVKAMKIRKGIRKGKKLRK